METSADSVEFVPRKETVDWGELPRHPALMSRGLAKWHPNVKDRPPTPRKTHSSRLVRIDKPIKIQGAAAASGTANLSTFPVLPGIGKQQRLEDSAMPTKPKLHQRILSPRRSDPAVFGVPEDPKKSAKSQLRILPAIDTPIKYQREPKKGELRSQSLKSSKTSELPMPPQARSPPSQLKLAVQ